MRAAGVSFEDRQDLLGHKSGRITTHYSAAAELGNLIEAANKVCISNKSTGIILTLHPQSTHLKKEIFVDFIATQNKPSSGLKSCPAKVPQQIFA